MGDGRCQHHWNNVYGMAWIENGHVQDTLHCSYFRLIGVLHFRLVNILAGLNLMGQCYKGFECMEPCAAC